MGDLTRRRPNVARFADNIEPCAAEINGEIGKKWPFQQGEQWQANGFGGTNYFQTQRILNDQNQRMLWIVVTSRRGLRKSMDRKISYRCIWRPTRRGTFGWNGFPTRYMPNSNTTPSALFCCLYRLFTMGIDSTLEERWDSSKGFVAQTVDRLLPWKRTCWFAKRLMPVLIYSQRITPVTIMPYGLNLEARSAENHRFWPFS